MKVNTSTLFFAALAISGVAAAPIADALGIVQPVARHEPRDEGYCVFGCRITAILSRRQNADQLTRRDPGKGDPEYCPDGDCWTKVKTVRRQNTDQLTRRDPGKGDPEYCPDGDCWTVPGKGDPEYCPDGDCWTKVKTVRRQNTDRLTRRDPEKGDGDRGE